jgi:putative transposase
MADEGGDAMSKHRFSSGARIRWQGTTYQIIRLLPLGQANIENILSGATLIVEISTLVRALFASELHFVSKNGKVVPDAQEESRAAEPYLSLSDYPAELVSIARYRLEAIRPLLEMGRRTRADILDRVQKIKTAQQDERSLQNSVSAASIYRWISDYENSSNDLRALIPSVHERGGKHTTRLREETDTLVEMVIQDKYKAHEKVTIDDIRYELAVRIAEENRVRPSQDQLNMPSRATLARRIAASSACQDYKNQRKQSSIRQTEIQCGQTPYPGLPLERVEIDHTRSDLVVIDDRDNLPLGRLTFTYCLDTATRYPLGYYLGFEPPSYLTVMECLHHAIQPKGDVRKLYGVEHEWLAYGIPSTLVIDNGKEFIGRDLEDACLLLGVVLQYTPARTPQFKAGVERMFGSLNTMFFHTLPGTTFSNPAERGSYNSAGQACVYLSDVDKMINIFLLDFYAERFHHGLNSIPARRWEEKIQHGFAPALPPSAEELSILLGRTTTRVIHHYGVEFASLRYNCDDLILLRTRLKGQAAKIKYHPADLSCLYVYDTFERQYIRVPALADEYTHSLSLWKHRVIRQVALEEQDRVDLVALGKAKRKIQQIVDADRQRKRQGTRARIARWDSAGKPTRQARAELDATETTADKNTEKQISLETNQPAGASPADENNWEISYLPLRHEDDLVDDEKQVQDG